MMLKRIAYILVIVGLILYSLRDYIDLLTYGKLSILRGVIFFSIIVFLLIVFIKDLVKAFRLKEKTWRKNLLFLGVILIFTFIISLKPFNPKLMVNYKEEWVWRGGYQESDGKNEPDFWKIFNAYGRLKLSSNGRFILNWRSILNSGNYYGDWSYSDTVLTLSYHGSEHKRIGTSLIYMDGKLYAKNSGNDLAPRVVLVRD